jgi:hypothetical protein
MNRLLRPTPAPCRISPDEWFPEGVSGHAAKREMEAAARVCKTMCTIRATCLAIAMQSEEGKAAGYRFGVFGGYTPAERADQDQTVVKPTAGQQALAA